MNNKHLDFSFLWSITQLTTTMEEKAMRLIRNFMIFTVLSLTALGVSAQQASKDNSKEVTCLDENFDWSTVENTTYWNNPKLVIVNPGEGRKFPVQLKYKASKGSIEVTQTIPVIGNELYMEFAYDLEPIGSGNKANIDVILVNLTWDQKADQISQEQEKQIESILEGIRSLQNIVYSYTLTEAGQWVDFRKKSGEINNNDKRIDFSLINKLFLFGVPKQAVGKNAQWYLASAVKVDEKNALLYCTVYTVKKILEKKFEIEEYATRKHRNITEFSAFGQDLLPKQNPNWISSTSKIDLEKMTVERKISASMRGIKFKETTKITPNPQQQQSFWLMDFSL